MDDDTKLKRIKFKVSAPGRIILYGEPLAMYGKRVVATSIDLRTTLKFCEITDNRRYIIKIDFPDIDLWLNLSLEQVLNFFFNNIDNADHFLKENILLHRYVQYFITLNGMGNTYEQRFSLHTFFYLFILIVCAERLNIKSFHVCLTSQLPMRAGLGSSTSFAICLAASFLYWARLQKGIEAFYDGDLEDISGYVLECEEVIENYVANIDNDVCSYGGIIKFRYDIRTGYNETCNIIAPRMKILLIDSRIRQNKLKQMKRMAELKFFYPMYLNIILNVIDYISKQACRELNALNFLQGNHLQNTYKTLKIFISLSQKIFHDLGLSHPNIDIICAIAREYGFAGKLTSFGGKYVYILLSPDVAEENIMRLSAHLMLVGFAVTKTSVNCSGVRINDLY
ncbi:Mevalonate kinase [Camponotus floridanus]|uniref:Mevalonate kinase n=1 Tax=Camponotus floridanus TaxID=104421 RepID=E2AW66_CAMFO|nr:Mevalonate kinase [Camponotus floridanus]